MASSNINLLETLENPKHRFADLVIHPTQPHLLVAVREDYTDREPHYPSNEIVTVNTISLTVSILMNGAEFYQSPQISPDSNRLAFIRWLRPFMPWETSAVCVVGLNVSQKGLSLRDRLKNVVSEKDESVSQPLWASNDSLVFTSDEKGFSNPWVWDGITNIRRSILRPRIQADFVEPAWQFGDYRIVVLSETQILAAPLINSKPCFGVLDLVKRTMVNIPTPYVTASRIRRVSSTSVVFIGSRDDVEPALVLFTFVPNPSGTVYATSFEILKATSDISTRFPATLISTQEPIVLDNPRPERPLHVLLALPKNPDYDPAGNGRERPPCVVLAHDGPTSRVAPGLSWITQFFTSRGWALSVHPFLFLREFRSHKPIADCHSPPIDIIAVASITLAPRGTDASTASG